MAAKKNQARERGSLEVAVTFEPHGGGDSVQAVTTPSMWAVADEWSDTLRAEGKHTDAWVDVKLVDAICLQAAQSEGLARGGAPSLARIAELKNRYDYRIEDDGEAEPSPNAEPPAGGA